MSLSALSTFLVAIPVLIMVAFLTLLERKILGITQYRKGPNKVSYVGILQPIADALKLFSKENTNPVQSNFLLFILGPLLSLSLSLMIWMFTPLKESNFSIAFSIFFLLMVMSFGVYPLMMSGWSSNNKYSSWGACRGVAQTISYEVSLTVILFSTAISLTNTSLLNSLELNMTSKFIIFSFPLVALLFILCVVETNRTPFDFAEGESELVSGFNTEYSSGTFALIFLAEYASILFFSLLLSCVMGLNSSSYALCYLITSIMASLWIWVRATYPRYRYDLLMSISWKTILPLSLAICTYILALLSL